MLDEWFSTFRKALVPSKRREVLTQSHSDIPEYVAPQLVDRHKKYGAWQGNVFT
jgi:hypothetical protein